MSPYEGYFLISFFVKIVKDIYWGCLLSTLVIISLYRWWYKLENKPKTSANTNIRHQGLNSGMVANDFQHLKH
jgi:hypothetical protein